MDTLTAIIYPVMDIDRTGRSKAGYAIAARMKELDIAQLGLARSVGRRQPWVSQYLLAETDRAIRNMWLQNPDDLVKLLDLLEWTPLQFQEATGIDMAFFVNSLEPARLPGKRDAAIPAELIRVPFRGSASAGVAPDPDATIEIPRKLARMKTAVYVVDGESMAPTLEDGDTVLVDESANALRNNVVFAIRPGGNGVQIRRCMIMKAFDQIIFLPDNKEGEFPTYELENDDIEVLGVVYSVLGARPVI